MFAIVLQDQGSTNVIDVDQFDTEAEAREQLDGLMYDLECTARVATEADASALDQDGRFIVAQWFDGPVNTSLVAIYEQD